MRNSLHSDLEEAGYVKVGLRRSRTGQLLTGARVGGADLLVALDSGASATVLDRESVARTGLGDLEERCEGAGAGGRVQAFTAQVEEIALSGARLPLGSVTVMDLEHVNAQLTAIGEDRLDGVIGADLLGRHEAVIDYGGPALYLRATEP